MSTRLSAAIARRFGARGEVRDVATFAGFHDSALTLAEQHNVAVEALLRVEWNRTIVVGA